jgi:competence protein ComEA
VRDSSHSTIVIWLVAAAIAVVAGVRLLGGSDTAPVPVSVDGARRGSIDGAAPGSGGAAATTAGGGAAAATAGGGDELYVHVAGAVRKPGLIRLPQGTRVATALERAGGPTRRADLTLVNLAARVQDGQQIVVPVVGAGAAGMGAAGAAGAGGATGASAVPGAKLHLSSATPEQLDQVDGIGPTLAERIVQYRTEHGGFRSIEELAEVEGIGEQRLATLRDALQP